MKKSLIAVAVAAALPAVAQAQTSVTLYGIIDLGLNWQDRGTDAAGNKRSAATIESGVQSTNLDHASAYAAQYLRPWPGFGSVIVPARERTQPPFVTPSAHD